MPDRTDRVYQVVLAQQAAAGEVSLFHDIRVATRFVVTPL